MRRSNGVAAAGLLAVLALAPALLVVSALADLRSPDGTAELGTSLAADPAVRTVLAAGVVDALVEDLTARSPATTLLLPALRPTLSRTAAAALDTPAGRAAVASTLTDALRHLTLPGPVVIDLRAAARAAADELPEPFDAPVRLAVDQGRVGVLVLGASDAETGTTAADVTPADADGRVAGVPGGPAVAGGAVLLMLAVLMAVLPARRRGRVAALTGTWLAVTGGAGLMVLRRAPELLVERLGDVTALPGPLAVSDAAVAVLLDGLVGLLARTGLIAGALLAGGGLLLVAAVLAGLSARSGGSPVAG
jgi:hypothetical protein